MKIDKVGFEDLVFKRPLELLEICLIFECADIIQYTDTERCEPLTVFMKLFATHIERHTCINGVV